MKSKLFIPALNQKVSLAKSVKVTIWHESRNEKFLEKVPNQPKEYVEYQKRFDVYYEKTKAAYELWWKWVNERHYEEYHKDPAFTEETEKRRKACGLRPTQPEHYIVQLPAGTYTIDRIYIRKSCKDFDSVTFRSQYGRFWLKLDEVNRVGFRVEEP
jgi:hypothetical protein